jgi:uncharacterized membrane protein
VHPALIELAEKRARSAQDRVADTITRFAGSMWFVYLHIDWLAAWIGLGVVSLEAIFLSTFVMMPRTGKKTHAGS